MIKTLRITGEAANDKDFGGEVISKKNIVFVVNLLWTEKSLLGKAKVFLNPVVGLTLLRTANSIIIKEDFDEKLNKKAIRRDIEHMKIL